MADSPASPAKRIVGNPTVAGAGMGVVIAWVWNIYQPDAQMPAEVAAGIAPMIGHVIRWAVAWLPEPSKD